MSSDKQRPTEIDEASLEQATGGLNFTKPGPVTNNRAIKWTPNLDQFADPDNSSLPDLPDRPDPPGGR